MAGLGRAVGRSIGRGFGKGVGRGMASARFQGIRFRLGVTMAIALLPILALGAIQSQADFRRQAIDRGLDLQLAANRAAATTKSRIDSAAILLETLSPEALGLYCAPRLTALVDRLEDYDALYRFSPTGQSVCASGVILPASPPASDGTTAEGTMAGPVAPEMTVSSQADAATPRAVSAANTAWFQRLRSGETLVLTRADARFSGEPALIAAVRAERPMGRFDGAMAAIIPLNSLQPDITDPALPEGAQAALTDSEGRILTATDVRAFTLTKGQSLDGWVARARAEASALFEGDDASGQHRVYAGAALAGRDVYVLLSAPAPGLLSWARLNPIGSLLLPLAAWFTAFTAVMLVSERLVVRWLDYLERVAAIYARGRFSVRPVQAANAPSEIRLLAATLDELAENITSRDKMLNESLAEKDALMREIHHRVKNNLQIISSLLSMQQRALTDAPAKAALGDTRQRISALALIYRTLYPPRRRQGIPDRAGRAVGSLRHRARKADHQFGGRRQSAGRSRQAGAPGPVAGGGRHQRPEARLRRRRRIPQGPLQGRGRQDPTGSRG
ncbi:sensor histidine kinase [Brevundimonas sp.]|uniref:sensor histidine kinase n=1 Tax=Brevundimonas sp. TaxID=1871086 RepID=UPI003BA88BB0